MRPFLDDNFLLNGETAIDLYHSFAKDMPIIDYHCHLTPRKFTRTRRFAILQTYGYLAIIISGERSEVMALKRGS